MIDEILSAYDIIPNEIELTHYGNGLINETWRIKNNNIDYILQKINHKIFKDPEAIASNVRLLADYLSQNHPDFLFIEPVKTKRNEEIIYLPKEGYFRIYPFVKQSHTIIVVKKPQQAFQAAKKFGQFTKLLSAFPIKKLQITLPDFHNLSLRYEHFNIALKGGRKDRVRKSEKLIKYIITNNNILKTYEAILHNRAFKLRVTHHDTKISNVLFDDHDKGICVIDLDTAMPGYFISDVGDMMRTYLSAVSEEEKDFSKIVIREEYFIAIYDGYMSEMRGELSAEEKENFIYAGKFMIYMQALRFLTDYLNNDIYYGVKYKNNNLVRAENQTVLLQRLLDKEASLRALINF